MLKLKNLSFSYAEEKVLADISFSAEKGELITLIGPNGSGKSTLLKCITSYLKIDSGSVEINGNNIYNLPRRKRAELIAYVPQQREFNFPMTVFEAVLMGRKPYSSWKPSQLDKELTAEVISDFNLEQIAFKNISQLSGGQQQKVFAARAVVQDSELILLDEPTSNLDLKHQLEIFEVIENQVKKDKTVIAAVHDLGLASRFSQRIIMLKDGKVYSDGDRNSLTHEKINDVYGVEVSLKEHNGYKVVIADQVIKV